MTIKFKTPNGGDETIKPGDVLVVREPLGFEEKDMPEIETVIRLGGQFILSIEPLKDVLQKLSALKLVQLTAPGKAIVFVSAERVTDVDAPLRNVDHPKAVSVLRFGPGGKAPRQPVAETLKTLKEKWAEIGIPDGPDGPLRELRVL